MTKKKIKKHNKIYNLVNIVTERKEVSILTDYMFEKIYNSIQF